MGTRPVIFSDLTGDEGEVITVRFSFEGRVKDIDLTQEERDEFASKMQIYLDKGRTPEAKPTPPPADTASNTSKTKTGRVRTEADDIPPDTLRAYYKEHLGEIPANVKWRPEPKSKGRIPNVLRDNYLAKMKAQAQAQ